MITGASFLVDERKKSRGTKPVGSAQAAEMRRAGEVLTGLLAEYPAMWRFLKALAIVDRKLDFDRSAERKFPAIPIGVFDVKRISFSVLVIAAAFQSGSRAFEFLDGVFFLLPGQI